MNFTLDEWSLMPLSWAPFQIAAAPSVVFFTGGNSGGAGLGQLVRLDPAHNVLTAWVLPFQMTSPGDIGFSRDYVFVTDLFAILQFNPATNAYRKWSVPFGISPSCLAFDANQNVYFCGFSNSDLWVGRLHDGSGTFSLWPVPNYVRGSEFLSDMIVDANGNVFLGMWGESGGHASNRIDTLDPVANTFSTWSIKNQPLAMGVDRAGAIVFSEWWAGTGKTIARLEPHANTLTEWGPIVLPDWSLAMTPKGDVYLPNGLPNVNAIIRFDPSAPGSTISVPIVSLPSVVPSVVSAVPTTGRASPTSQTISPSVTTITASPVGAFTTLPLPSPFSGPRHICANKSGEVFFTEQAGSRIGRLR